MSENQNTELVSVIVPCYNYAQFLGEALDSVIAQTYANWECIIINDGSPDNTEEVALKYCEKDTRFKYFYKQVPIFKSMHAFIKTTSPIKIISAE